MLKFIPTSALSIVFFLLFITVAYCQQPGTNGYTIIKETVDPDRVIEIKPDSTFRLDDFLNHDETVPVTPVKPVVKYRYDEGKDPEYVVERPERIDFQHRWYGFYHVQRMEELPREIVFSHDVADGKTVRRIAVDGQQLEILSFDPLFGEETLNNGGLSIDYRESEFYYLYDEMDKLLIVSHPMIWTGLMTNFSLYQIMDMRQGDDFGYIQEFISFGDSPYLFFRENDYGYFERMEISGDYDPAAESWNLSIRGGSENTFRELAVTGHNEKEVIIRGYTGDAHTPAKIRVAEVEAGEHLELAVERPALQMAENFLNGRPYNRGDDPGYGNRILYTTDKDYYWAQCRFGKRVPEFVTDTLFRTGRAAYDRITTAINGLTKWSASGLVGTWFDENPQVEADGSTSSMTLRLIEKAGGYDVLATGECRYYRTYRDLDDEPEVEREYPEAAFGFEATIKDGREISDMKLRKIIQE